MSRDKRLLVFALTEYTVKGERDPRTSWCRVGRAFENKDGSINLELEALPVSGRLQIREESEQERERRETRQRERNDNDRRGDRRDDGHRR